MSWRSSDLSEHLGIRICFSGGIGDGSDAGGLGGDAGGFGGDAGGYGGDAGDVGGDLGSDVSSDMGGMGGDFSADSYGGDAGFGSEGYGSDAGLSSEGYGSDAGGGAYEGGAEIAADTDDFDTEVAFGDSGTDGYGADLSAMEAEMGIASTDIGGERSYEAEASEIDAGEDSDVEVGLGPTDDPELGTALETDEFEQVDHDTGVEEVALAASGSVLSNELSALDSAFGMNELDPELGSLEPVAFTNAGLQPEDIGFVETLATDTFPATNVDDLAVDEAASIQLAQATQSPSVDLTPPDRLPDSNKFSAETVTSAKAGVDTPFGVLSHDTQIKSHLDYSVTPGSIIEQSVGPDLFNPTPMEHIAPEELNLPSEVTNHDALVTPEKLTQTLMNNENASVGLNVQVPGLGGANATVGSTVSNGSVKSWDLSKDSEAGKSDQDASDTRVNSSVLSGDLTAGSTAHQGFDVGSGTVPSNREFEK